jgi:hypothetical protein
MTSADESGSEARGGERRTGEELSAFDDFVTLRDDELPDTDAARDATGTAGGDSGTASSSDDMLLALKRGKVSAAKMSPKNVNNRGKTTKNLTRPASPRSTKNGKLFQHFSSLSANKRLQKSEEDPAEHKNETSLSNFRFRQLPCKTQEEIS